MDTQQYNTNYLYRTPLHFKSETFDFIWLLNFICFCCLYTGCDSRLRSHAAAADTGREVAWVAASAHRALQVAELRARAGLVADGGVVLRAEAGRHAGLRGHAHHALHLLAVPPPLLLGQPAQCHDIPRSEAVWAGAGATCRAPSCYCCCTGRGGRAPGGRTACARAWSSPRRGRGRGPAARRGARAAAAGTGTWRQTGTRAALRRRHQAPGTGGAVINYWVSCTRTSHTLIFCVAQCNM